MARPSWQNLRFWSRLVQLRPYRRRRLGFEVLEQRLAPATWSGDIFDTAPGTPLWTNTQVQEITGEKGH